MTEAIYTGLDIRPQPWMRHGLCKEQTEEFFPDPDASDKSNIMLQHRRAIAVCRGCPVRGECLEYAMEKNEIHGVWGGMTPSQRRALRNQRARSMP